MNVMNMELRKRILLGYGVVLLAMALVLVWAFVNLLSLRRAAEAILSENYRSIIAAENMIDALERQDSGSLLHFLGVDPESTQQFHENEKVFLQWLARARDNVTIEGEAEIIRRIDSAYAKYLAAYSAFIGRPYEDGYSIGTAYETDLWPSFARVRKAGGELRDLNEQTMEAASRRAGEVAARAMWSLGLVGALTLIVGLLFSLTLSNRLVQPLQRIHEATKRIAEGNYDVAVPIERNDEFGRLAAQFNEMAVKLSAYRDLNLERIMSEQQKSEAVIESIDDGLIVFGPSLEIENINPAAARILDVSGREVLGSEIRAVVDDDEVFRTVKSAVDTGEVPALREEKAYFSVERGGTQQHYQYVVSPVRTPSRGAILLIRDVTKVKELDRLKTQFVATASHELKTPLTSIGMSIALLQERAGGKLDARELDLLSAAGEDVDRLRRLVNDLLDLSKIEAGGIELEFEEVPVVLLFEKAMQSLRPQAEEKGIELSGSVSDGLPDVRADANKITWVLTNLISNALRYTNAGGHVELRAIVTGPSVSISVRDDGEGIPYGYQAKIFDKFVQVGGLRSAGGSGLGLAISKEIVRAHGGSIWVESMPGMGATFTFTLPRTRGAASSHGDL